MEWRQIELDPPPKDGSWVVLTSTWNKHARAAMYFEAAADSWLDMGESEVYDLTEYFTHWMSLPGLPEPSP